MVGVVNNCPICKQECFDMAPCLNCGLTGQEVASGVTEGKYNSTPKPAAVVAPPAPPAPVDFGSRLRATTAAAQQALEKAAKAQAVAVLDKFQPQMLYAAGAGKNEFKIEHTMTFASPTAGREFAVQLLLEAQRRGLESAGVDDLEAKSLALTFRW